MICERRAGVGKRLERAALQPCVCGRDKGFQTAHGGRKGQTMSFITVSLIVFASISR